MPGEKRDVQVKLSLEMGPQNERAMKDLERQLAQASKANERLMQSAAAAFNPLIKNPAGGTGGAAGLGSSGGTGKEGGGGLGGMMGGKLGKLLGGALAVDTLVRGTTSFANIANDPYTTSAQGSRQFFREMVPYGSKIQDMVDAINGRKAGYERAERVSERLQAAFGVQNRATSVGMSMNPRVMGMSERANQLGTAEPVLMGPIDRSTGIGERNYQEMSRLLPLRRELVKAEREAAVATKERVGYEIEQGKLLNREKQLRGEISKLEKWEQTGDQSGPKRQQTLLQLRDFQNQLETNLEQQQQGRANIVEARGREATAQGQPALIRARLLEERASLLDQRAETASNAAVNLGTMGPAARARGVEALRILNQTQNPDMLPPQLLQQALAIGGVDAQRIAERYGASTPEFQELRKLAPGTYGGNPEELRRQANKDRDEAESERLKAEASIAKTAAKAGEDFGAFIDKIMTEMLTNAMARIETQWKTRKNSP